MRSIRPASSAAALACAALSLASCAGGDRPAAVAEKPVAYAVPVAAGCVAAQGRPAAVTPLNRRYSAAEWAAMPPGAKAQAVAAQGGARMNHEDEAEAATSACK